MNRVALSSVDILARVRGGGKGFFPHFASNVQVKNLQVKDNVYK